MTAGAGYVGDWSAAGYTNLINFGMSCAGLNRALVAFIFMDTSLDKLIYIKYDGVDLTFEAKIPSAGIQYMHVYSMLNPPTGTKNLITSLSSNQNLHVHAITLDGVEQSGDPFGTVVWGEANSNSPSRVVNSNNRSVVLDTVGYLDDTIVPTAGSGQTKVVDTNISSASRAASSWEAGADPTVSMDWSLSSSVQWLIGALSIQGTQKKSSRALLFL